MALTVCPTITTKTFSGSRTAARPAGYLCAPVTAVAKPAHHMRPAARTTEAPPATQLVLPEELMATLVLPFPALPTAAELESAMGATLAQVYGWLLRPSCHAGAYVATTCLALGLPINAWAVAALAAAVYVIYAYDRVKDAASAGDQINNSSRARFCLRHRPAIMASIYGACAVLAAAVASLPASFGVGLLACVALALCYAVPIPGLNGVSLRTAPGCKTLTTTSLWAYGTAWLPVAAGGGVAAAAGGAPAVAAMCLHVLTTTLGSVFKDLADIEGDAADGTRSIPVLLGKANTLRLIVCMSVLDAVVCAAVLGHPALLIPNAALVAHALTFDQGGCPDGELNSFWVQLGALALLMA